MGAAEEAGRPCILGGELGGSKRASASRGSPPRQRSPARAGLIRPHPTIGIRTAGTRASGAAGPAPSPSRIKGILPSIRAAGSPMLPSQTPARPTGLARHLSPRHSAPAMARRSLSSALACQKRVQMELGPPGSNRAEGRAVLGPGVAAGAIAGGGVHPSCMDRKGPPLQSRGIVVVMAEITGQDGEEGAGVTLAGEGVPREAPLYTSKQCRWLPTHENT